MQSIPEAAAYIRRDDEENVTLLDEPEPAEVNYCLKFTMETNMCAIIIETITI
jgi:hypothetical protein